MDRQGKHDSSKTRRHFRVCNFFLHQSTACIYDQGLPDNNQNLFLSSLATGQMVDKATLAWEEVLRDFLLEHRLIFVSLETHLYGKSLQFQDLTSFRHLHVHQCGSRLLGHCYGHDHGRRDHDADRLHHRLCLRHLHAWQTRLFATEVNVGRRRSFLSATFFNSLPNLQIL